MLIGTTPHTEKSKDISKNTSDQEKELTKEMRDEKGKTKTNFEDILSPKICTITFK